MRSKMWLFFLLISRVHEHRYLRGNYFHLKANSLKNSSFPLGASILKMSYWKHRRSQGDKGDCFAKRAPLVTQKAKPDFWETRRCGNERDSMSLMLDCHWAVNQEFCQLEGEVWDWSQLAVISVFLLSLSFWLASLSHEEANRCLWANHPPNDLWKAHVKHCSVALLSQLWEVWGCTCYSARVSAWCS